MTLATTTTPDAGAPELPRAGARSTDGGSPGFAVAEAITLDEALAAAAEPSSVLATVNRRLARDLSERFARARVAAGAAWWETPAILPLPSWLAELHDAALARGTSDRARLSPLVAQRRWSGLVALRHESLLDVDSAAREARRAWQLGHAWDCLPDGEGYLSDDQFAWRTWADAYGRRLDDEALVDAATLPDHLVGLAAAGRLELPRQLVLAGFLAPTPQQRRLVEALATAGVRVRAVTDAGPVVPRCTAWPDDVTELRAVADAVHARLAAEPRARLGVVVPDLDARRGEVLRAFDRRFFPGATPDEIERVGRPYDVSLGRPLSDAAPVRSALLLLRLAFGRLDRHGVSALLLSPYLAGASEECRRRERLERKLRDWRVRSLDLKRFADRLDEDSRLRAPLYRLERRIKPLRRGRHSALPDWADRFADALAAFGWPGEGLSSEEYQAVRALHGVLDDLQALEEGDTVGLPVALGELHRLARERVFQPESPELPIRVLGRLESHGLRFDALWVAGLDSERWPPAGSPTPFLQVAAQKAVGMPEASPEARLALARREYAHWCASAPELWASCAMERSGQPLVPAAALQDIRPGGFDDADPAAAVRAAAGTEIVADAFGPATADGANVPGGARLLEDQAKCPFRAFARHRLGIRPLEEAGIGQDPRQRGTRLHRALEGFWRDTGSHAALVALGDGALAARVDASVDASLAEDEFMDETLRGLERRRLVELLHEWIEVAERPRAPFEVVAFEQSVEFEHGGLHVRLQIDRIDRIDGRLVVLDYKTGTHDDVGPWSDERIVNPQLPLYALAEGDVSGVAFARAVPFRCGFLGVAADDGLLPGVGRGLPPREWHDWRGHWREALDRTVAEVRAGQAGVRPLGDACTHCELRGLCRIDVASGDADAGEPGA